MIKAPSFWYKRPGIISVLLAPLAALYAASVYVRLKIVTPFKVNVPVICVGNLVMGGAGKTPTAIKLAKMLQQKGQIPHILSRGYGVKVNTPTRVDPSRHNAQQVGDEPLLLATVAPTWVYPDRIASARVAIAAGATVLIMDDGFQNPHMNKNLSLLVIDGQQGLGNGKVFPAGPLREHSDAALARANAIVMIGSDQQNLNETHKLPILQAHIKLINEQPSRVLAFTGLGFPSKFFDALRKAGYDLAETKAFPDHHPYKETELKELIAQANSLGARLITTEKDLVRIPPRYHDQIQVLKIELAFESETHLDRILEAVL